MIIYLLINLLGVNNIKLIVPLTYYESKQMKTLFKNDFE